MNPLIAVISTSGEDRNSSYIDTIIAHQGTPFLLEPGQPYKTPALNGILLTGGGDLNEIYYDHELSPKERKTLGRVEPRREAYETELLSWAMQNDIPTLGICRGFQMMAVFSGGSLIPDVPTWQKKQKIKPVLKHRQEGDKSLPAHTVQIETGTIFASIFGSKNKMGVNSSHHQAVSACPSALRVSARSPDGIIEAFENPAKKFWMGVQFHPERMWQRDSSFSNLFRTFTEHAQRTAL